MILYGVFMLHLPDVWRLAHMATFQSPTTPMVFVHEDEARLMLDRLKQDMPDVEFKVMRFSTLD